MKKATAFQVTVEEYVRGGNRQTQTFRFEAARYARKVPPARSK